jgi:hypothetical protein
VYFLLEGFFGMYEKQISRCLMLINWKKIPISNVSNINP